jgi:hypothetical protein
LINQQAVNNGGTAIGFINPAIYALGQATNYASLFHDITTGNNTNAASDNLYFAVPGYDLCTGWGTPAGQNLIDALAGPALPTPPFLTSQPQSQTVVVSGTVTLSAEAAGAPPLSFQWEFNGTNLIGATNESLTLNYVQMSQGGDYALLVTNEYGSTLSATAVLTVNPPPPGDPTPAGLVSWWKGEGNANDTMGLNNGTVTGSLGYAGGEVGQAFVFDGSTSYITVPASPSLDIGTTGTGITIEGWINPSDDDVTVNGAPVVEWASGATDGVQLWTGQALYANIKDSDDNPHIIQSANGLLTANTWQHLALTYDEASGNADIYLNGQVVAAQNLGSFIPETALPLNIGVDPAPIAGPGDIYNGLMDEVSIYNRALGSNEIQAIFLAGGNGKSLAAPLMATQPTNQVAESGNTVSFAVAASGSGTLGYQWYWNTINNPIAGATNASLVLANVQPANDGAYFVLVTNFVGAALSGTATLVVHVQDHFAWSIIPSPRFVNAPFTATIQAQDAANGLVTNFTGTVNLSSTLGVPVQPAVAGPFAGGSWTGAVTVEQMATNLVLEATDEYGDIGLANPVSILSPPVLGVAQYGGVLLISWPAYPGGFVVETSPRLDAASSNWVPVAVPPILFWDQYLEAFPITVTNRFFRLLYTVP